jgi:aminoglycoside phosphotransferase (APT) family kinase protein
MPSSIPGATVVREFLPPALTAWLADHVGDDGPFTVTVMSGGNSNETARIESSAGQWILRCAPAAAISPTANNLSREFRVLQALSDEDVPTPRVLAYTDGGEVSPRPCLLMECREGTPLVDAWPVGWPQDGSAVGDVARSAVDALARLHRVDWAGIGLTDFGRPAGYLGRQVARWRAQYELNQVRDLPLFEQLSSWLEGNCPAEQEPALIHGDFHLDNCLFVPGPPARVSAVIDWELSTIGDPLMDLGLLLAFWGSDRPELPAMPRVQAVSRTPGAPTRRELADLYTSLTGRSTEDLSFYMALAFFKLAAIVEGAYARFLSGEVDSEYARNLAADVPRLLDEAARFADIS